MSFKEVLWEVPANWFQEFDRGATICDEVPAYWELQVGDRVEYGTGSTISGIAEVMSVGTEPSEIFDWSATFGDGEDPPKTPGLKCGFKKVS